MMGANQWQSSNWGEPLLTMGLSKLKEVRKEIFVKLWPSKVSNVYIQQSFSVIQNIPCLPFLLKFDKYVP